MYILAMITPVVPSVAAPARQLVVVRRGAQARRDRSRSLAAAVSFGMPARNPRCRRCPQRLAVRGLSIDPGRAVVPRGTQVPCALVRPNERSLLAPISRTARFRFLAALLPVPR